MKNINITVENKRAAVVGSPLIICGNSDYTVTFAFDNEWSLTGVRTARFVYVKRGEVMHEDKVFEGNTVAVPVLSDVTFVNVGVFAGDLCTTTPARVNCHPSILCGSGIVQVPTTDVYAQIMALFEEMAEKGAFGATEAQAQQIEQNRQGIAALEVGTKKAGKAAEADKAATADDASKLGGQFPSHYATAEELAKAMANYQYSGIVINNADELNSALQSLHDNAKDRSYYCEVLNINYSSVFSGGQKWLEGYKQSATHGWQKITFWSSEGTIETKRTLTSTGWKDWVTTVTKTDLTAELAKYLPHTGGLVKDLQVGEQDFLAQAGLAFNRKGAIKQYLSYDDTADDFKRWNTVGTAKTFLDTGNMAEHVLPKVDALAKANSQSNVPMFFKGGTHPQISLLEFLGSDDSVLGRFGFRNGSLTVSDSTKTNYYDILHTGNSAKVHIGTSAPSDTTSVWFDTSGL